MVTESVVDNISPVPLAITSGALAADLLADSADLLDVAATLNIEFRRVVAELRRAPASPAPRVLDALTLLDGTRAALGRPRPGAPHGDDAPPFVWVSLVPTTRRSPRGRRAGGIRAGSTVRAGWLDGAAVQRLVAEARALGPETEIHVIVPLDSRDGTTARVRALCAGIAPGIKLTIDVQGEMRTSRGPSLRRTRWWGPSGRASRGARPEGRGFRAGTWVVLDPARAS